MKLVGETTYARGIELLEGVDLIVHVQGGVQVQVHVEVNVKVNAI